MGRSYLDAHDYPANSVKGKEMIWPCLLDALGSGSQIFYQTTLSFDFLFDEIWTNQTISDKKGVVYEGSKYSEVGANSSCESSGMSHTSYQIER